MERVAGDVIDGDALLVLEKTELERARVRNLFEGLAAVPRHPVSAEVVAVRHGDLTVWVQVRPERVEGQHGLVDAAPGTEAHVWAGRIAPARPQPMAQDARRGFAA